MTTWELDKKLENESIEKAVAAERERCAKIAEERAARMAGDWSAGSSVASAIAKEIRDGI